MKKQNIFNIIMILIIMLSLFIARTQMHNKNDELDFGFIKHSVAQIPENCTGEVTDIVLNGGVVDYTYVLLTIALFVNIALLVINRKR